MLNVEDYDIQKITIIKKKDTIHIIEVIIIQLLLDIYFALLLMDYGIHEIFKKCKGRKLPNLCKCSEKCSTNSGSACHSLTNSCQNATIGNYCNLRRTKGIIRLFKRSAFNQVA